MVPRRGLDSLTQKRLENQGDFATWERGLIEPAAAAVPSAERMRVLIIDDEPTLLAAATRVLAATHDVSTSSGGKAALDLLAANDFDLVLCDMMLADMEGVQIYEAAVRARPDLEPRFLFMTGGALTPRSIEFKSTLGERCLSKPFDAPTLIEAVARHSASLAAAEPGQRSRRVARVG